MGLIILGNTMSTHYQKLVTVLGNTFQSWYNHDPFRESSIIAYYAIFSLPGLLVVIITLAGYFFGNEAVNNQLAVQFSAPWEPTPQCRFKT
jgi:membrane protein